MKNIFTITLIAGTVLAACSSVAMADGGSVHLHALVQANSCTVSNDTRDQTVDMGTIARGTLTGKGSESARVPFTIKLVDCPAATTSVGFTTAGVTHGAADANDNTLYALDETSLAKGIGIAIYDAASAGEKITPNNAAAATYAVTDGAANIDLSASVVQSSDALIGGDFSAVTGFSIVYN